MGFITRAELELRLKSTKNLNNNSLLDNQKDSIKPSVEIHKKNLPEIKKNLISALVGQGEKVIDISRALNIPANSIQTIADKQKDVPKVKDTLDRVRELALDKTIHALGLMTEEKFENASLKDLASTASSCAKIIEKTNPINVDQRVQFIINRPESRNLDDYKVIDV